MPKNIKNHLPGKPDHFEKEKRKLVENAKLANDINKDLSNIGGYLGTLQISDLKNFRVRQFPAYFVINMPDKNHWIAVACFFNEVAICDPLHSIMPGKKLNKTLINCLSILSYNKKVSICPRLSKTNLFSAYYCIYFICAMTVRNFDDFLSHFENNFDANDLLVSMLYNSNCK